MKNFIIILIVFLITSCSNKKEYQGIWIGKIAIDETQVIPVLMKFENEYLIDYFSIPYDTLEYNIIGENITAFNRTLNEEYKFKLNRSKDNLTIFYPQSDRKLELHKSIESNFVYDFLSDKNLKIELPIGNAKEEVFGRDFNFLRPMYLTYQSEKLVANFFDTTVVVDSNYYKFLLKKQLQEPEREWFLYSVTLIADKNINISDIDLVKKQLNLVALNKINYILNSENYETVQLISMRTPPLPMSEYEKLDKCGLRLPPPPPPLPKNNSEFIKNHAILFEINGATILYNDTELQEFEIKKLIQEKAILDSNLTILFYLNENSVYQDYISFIDPVFSSFYELRDRYLSEKYKNLSYYSTEILDEAKKKHPIIIRELNQEEYKKTKYNL